MPIKYSKNEIAEVINLSTLTNLSVLPVHFWTPTQMHCSAFSPWAVFKLCTNHIPNTENQNNQRNHFRAVLFSSWSYLSSPLHLNLSVTQAHGSAESKAVGSVCPQRVTHHQTHTIRFSVWARAAKTLVKKSALKSSCFFACLVYQSLKIYYFWRFVHH